MTRTVAVIGGSGFIGWEIAKTLVAAGFDVSVLDLVEPQCLPGCRYRAFDLRRQSRAILVGGHYDAVVIAAGIMAKGCAEDPNGAWELNVTSTIALFDELSQQAKPVHVVFLSSGMVYDLDNSSSPLFETGAVKGVCTYTKSKLEVESFLTRSNGEQSLAALILRPFTVYGKGALSGERGHLFGRWLELGRVGSNLTIYGDGQQVIDPVHVDRVSQACLAYVSRDNPAGASVVNISSGGCLTIRRLAELFVQSGLAPGLDFLPAPEGDAARGWGDVTTYEQLVGYSVDRNPEVEVVDFLAELASEYGVT